MKNSALILLIGVAIAFSGCKKEPVEDDSLSPTITVKSPNAFTTYDNRSFVNFEFSIADNDKLHEFTARVTNEFTNELLLDLHEHTHTNPFTYDDTRFVQVDEFTHMVLTIEAVDHNGNQSIETIEFNVAE